MSFRINQYEYSPLTIILDKYYLRILKEDCPQIVLKNIYDFCQDDPNISYKSCKKCKKNILELDCKKCLKCKTSYHEDCRFEWKLNIKGNGICLNCQRYYKVCYLCDKIYYNIDNCECGRYICNNHKEYECFGCKKKNCLSNSCCKLRGNKPYCKLCLEKFFRCTKCRITKYASNNNITCIKCKNKICKTCMPYRWKSIQAIYGSASFKNFCKIYRNERNICYDCAPTYNPNIVNWYMKPYKL